jgi:hypothetical protein
MCTDFLKRGAATCKKAWADEVMNGLKQGEVFVLQERQWSSHNFVNVIDTYLGISENDNRVNRMVKSSMGEGKQETSAFCAGDCASFIATAWSNRESSGGRGVNKGSSKVRATIISGDCCTISVIRNRGIMPIKWGSRREHNRERGLHGTREGRGGD